MTTATSDAGWFDDPTDPSKLRYWDGQRWTDQRTPRPPAGQASCPQDAGLEATASLACGMAGVLTFWFFGIVPVLDVGAGDRWQLGLSVSDDDPSSITSCLLASATREVSSRCG